MLIYGVFVRRIVVLVCVMAGLGLGGCKGGSDSGPFLLVATTTQMAEFARIVGGEYVQVHGMLRPNMAADDYEATPADLKAIEEATVFVKSGLGLDAWFDEIVKTTASDAPVVDGSENVLPREVGGEVDPHYWQNPLYALVAVHNISVMLQRVDQEHAAYYAANEGGYTKRLGDLDREVRDQLQPLKNRYVVTTRDAFGYYFDHYQLVSVGSVIPTFSAKAELSAQARADLVAKIKQFNVKAIFSEQAVPSSVAADIAADTDITVVSGTTALYGDALGPAGSDAATYVGMIRHNTKTLVDNLS